MRLQMLKHCRIRARVNNNINNPIGFPKVNPIGFYKSRMCLNVTLPILNSTQSIPAEKNGNTIAILGFNDFFRRKMKLFLGKY